MDTRIQTQISFLQQDVLDIRKSLDRFLDNSASLDMVGCDEIASYISRIETGSFSFDVDFYDIGYSTQSRTEALDIAGVSYSLDLRNSWDSSATSWSLYDYSYKDKIMYFPSVNTSNITNFRRFFYAGKLLRYVPSTLDTSKGTDFSLMFGNCSSLESIPFLDTSNGTTFDWMFSGCSNIKTIPPIDTGKGTSFTYMFRGCTNLKSIPKLDLRSNTGALTDFLVSCFNLVDIGGFTGLNKNLSIYSSYLTRQSVLNILTEAADLTGLTSCNLGLLSQVKSRLTQEDYNFATSKNWNIV